MKKPVKLYLYNYQGQKTIVGIEEAEEFDDFVLVRVNASTMTDQDMGFFQEQLSEIFAEKKILIFDSSLEFKIYGVRELDELENKEIATKANQLADEETN
jgi:hypothetical protein